MAGPAWPSTMFDFSLFSRFGYFVLRPNPRGSFGQGEGFTRGNVKDFGYGDLRDVLAGVDYVVDHFPVDNNRVGIGGWSYGGYMTMWAVTQTHRFHAAVAGAGIANWQSYYGENDIDQSADSVLRRVRLRRSGRVREKLPHYLHQKRQNSHSDSGGGPRWRMPHVAIVRILACLEVSWGGESVCGLPQRRTHDLTTLRIATILCSAPWSGTTAT